jgi:hypothetical protein
LGLHPPTATPLNPRVSHIAAALAKSKGKNVTPPKPEGLHDVPTLKVGPPPHPVLQKPAAAAVKPAAAQTAAALAPAASAPPPRKRVGLFPGVAVLLVVAVAGVWFLTQTATPAPSIPAPTAPATQTPATPPAPAAPERAGPSDVLTEKMRRLPITAAAGGGSQRLSVAGKVFEPGDAVIEGLILQSIENAEIVFRDADGNLYTRRL